MIRLSALYTHSKEQPLWVSDLKKIVKTETDLKLTTNVIGKDKLIEDVGPIILVGARDPQLHRVLNELDRRGRMVLLIVEENEELPDSVNEEDFDDVCVYPFRKMELASKIRWHRLLDDVRSVNHSFSDLILKLRDDLQLAERLQKARLPSRLLEPRGFHIKSRYLAGLRSGGEYFDLVESQDRDCFAVLLSDSSSYGLSSAVLSVMMRVAAKLTGESSRSCAKMVERIHEEILLTLGEKETLSLFYGQIQKKDLTFRYLNLGSSAGFVSSRTGGVRALGTQGDPISRGTGIPRREDIQTQLRPEDRLVLVSDGFIQSVGGVRGMEKLISRFDQKEAVDFLNELSFSVKRHLDKGQELPPEDCTAVVVDVDAKVLRLATL